MNLQDERHDSSASQPEKVLLFSGHMIDRPDRAVARLPAAKAAAAGGRIAAALEALRAGPGDSACAPGAAGTRYWATRKLRPGGCGSQASGTGAA